MKKKIILQVRLMFAMAIVSFFSVQTEGRDLTNVTTQESPVQSSCTVKKGVYIADLISIMEVLVVQEPGDSLTKAELKALRRAERAEKRALARAEQQANRKVIDNPNHADYVILGDDLPKGQRLLDAISGRVPGMMIRGDGQITTRGPSTFYGDSTPLFLVDEVPTSKEYANSLSINDIERIEVFIGSSSAMYGTRAASGVISIYTKKTL